MRVVISEGLPLGLFAVKGTFSYFDPFPKVSWEQLAQHLVWKSSTDWLVQSMQTSFLHVSPSQHVLFVFCFGFFLWDS